jgi:hypothetical protein
MKDLVGGGTVIPEHLRKAGKVILWGSFGISTMTVSMT